MDNEDVGRTRHGKESLDASLHIERVENAQARTRRRASGRGRGRSKGPIGSSSQSQDDIEMPSSQVDPPPYLPGDLITKILLRLPVKSLIRFKSVSKLWFSLISDNHFANSHFQLTSSTHTHRILFLTVKSQFQLNPTIWKLLSPPEFRSIDLPSLFTDDYNEPVPLNPSFPLPDSHFHLQIIGSCRGFIFLHSCSKAYIWNPSTGFHRQIPFPPNVSRSFYGFGYDETKDDYLVVSLSRDYLWFFSLRANEWEEIVDTAHLPDCCGASSSENPLGESVFNGAIHWLASFHDTHVYLVVAFDLVERKLVEIPLPDDIDYDISKSMCHLWVFRGFLSLWVMVDKDTVDIWVMKEYKVQSSWTKTLVLTSDTIHKVSLVCCTKNGDIVGTDSRTGLVRYNDKGEFLGHNCYTGYSQRAFRVALYTESLLSLPSDNEQG